MHYLKMINYNNTIVNSDEIYVIFKNKLLINTVVRKRHLNLCKYFIEYTG
jgi:hypothetical protein